MEGFSAYDAPPHPEQVDSVDFPEDDRTQPAEEHLQALHALNNMNSSQDTDIVDSGPSSQAEPPPDTPTPQYLALRAQVQAKPTDVDAWQELIRLAESSGEHEKITETYEALLEVFPNTSSAQIAYIQHVLNSQSQNKHSTVAGLFNRFLKTSPFVDLWKFYLAHVRKMHPDPSSRDTVRKAYEYALNHIGHDKESNEIWTDYIQFLKSGEAATTWDEGQKMDAIRKAYQRAVQTPMENVKRLWEEYSEFETGLNKQLAKKFLSDLQTSHMQARTVLNSLQEQTATLLPPPTTIGDRLSVWLPRPPTFSSEDKSLVARWKQYLKWEESNPLEIEEKDRSQFHSRVQTVYRKALVRMRFFSEIWYMAYAWTLSVGNEQGLPENKRKERKDEALSILKAGIEANPKSFVLNFAYAEVLEDSKSLKEVHATFTKFLDVLRADLEELEASKTDDEPVPASNSGLRSNNSSFSTQSSDDTPNTKSKELKNRRTEYGIAWIVYMRFARRAENHRAARDIFGKARKDKWTPWEVYEAAALMEYHCTKSTDVAMRIFERGLEKFPDEEEFALRYLGFLISINDDSNARALFERVVTTFPPERARPLWERWARYEYQFGNLQAAQNLEKRLAEVYPNDPPIKRFAERHKYLGTDAIAVRDLGFNFGSSRSSNGHSSSSRSNGTPLGRSDTLQSIVSNISAQNQSFSSSGKRPSSPEPRRQNEGGRGSDHGPPAKRQRGGSPSKERDRDRWDGPPRRRHGSPSWDRDRDRDGSFKKEKEDDKAITLPPVLSWFIGVLPTASSFDGPVFRTDDLMQVFRNAVIPSSTGIGAGGSSSTGGGRPPPDYSPYQGPNPGRRGRY
ncbi:hypothetical protein BXZ70DRAFT_920835 [Cristinia sonorae]|uniref:mRNA 3'-end-processing protein RNA14 n=1 Tax=Cristinia sonorae TaxID=1940300 RepID=A0A8K0UWG5_9AGAR|nr:hypothetical protein BXZ70DRAFT_920835 [Cristinia sonorae]